MLIIGYFMQHNTTNLGFMGSDGINCPALSFQSTLPVRCSPYGKQFKTDFDIPKGAVYLTLTFIKRVL